MYICRDIDCIYIHTFAGNQFADLLTAMLYIHTVLRMCRTLHLRGRAGGVFGLAIWQKLQPIQIILTCDI